MEQRIIKFKAKRLGTGEWMEGDLLHHNNKCYIGIHNVGHNIVANVPIEVDPSTVCQFTGLVDMNGNDIWEHDYIYVVLPYILSGEVIYDNELCRYMIEPDKESSSNYTRCFSFAEIEEMSSFDEDIEIYAIGNKFDRKEEK